MIAAALAALALLADVPAATTRAPSPAEPGRQAEPAAETPVKDKVICRVQRAGVSRIPSRTCATASQWEARRRADQAALEKFGGDSLGETRRNYDSYLSHVADRLGH